MCRYFLVSTSQWQQTHAIHVGLPRIIGKLSFDGGSTFFPWNTASLTVFSASLTVNTNSINVPLCSEFCLMKPTDSICCTSILLLLTAHLLVVFMSVFSVYSMFYHDGVCLSWVSCSKRFTHLLTYLFVFHVFVRGEPLTLDNFWPVDLSSCESGQTQTKDATKNKWRGSHRMWGERNGNSCLMFFGLKCLHPKQGLDPFSCICTTKPRDRQTDRRRDHRSH